MSESLVVMGTTGLGIGRWEFLTYKEIHNPSWLVVEPSPLRELTVFAIWRSERVCLDKNHIEKPVVGEVLKLGSTVMVDYFCCSLI